MQDLADELGCDIETLFDTRLQEESHLWMMSMNTDHEESGNNTDLFESDHFHDIDDDSDDDHNYGNDADDVGNRYEPMHGLQKMIDIVRLRDPCIARQPCSCNCEYAGKTNIWRCREGDQKPA